MKEQLKKLRNEVIDMSNMKKKFVKKRALFNLKVEEAKEERPVVELFEGDLKDSYSRACCFYIWMEPLITAIERVKKEHPTYAESSIRSLVMHEFVEDNSNLLQIEGMERVLDLYFLYDGCNFLKVRDIENTIKNKKDNISENTKSMIGEVKGVAVDAVKNYDLVWEETKLNVSDAFVKTRRKIGKFLLDMDEEK